MKRLTLIAALVALSCGSPDQPAEGTAESSAARSKASTPAESPDYIRCPVKAVTLSGEPLRGMIPIATFSANAFQQPVASGEPTDDAGASVVHIPQGMELFVRAWDPSLEYFANNYYSVLPTEGNVTDTMEILMVEGSSLMVTFLDGDGNPLSKKGIRLMLSHPVEGPWWPTESVTDATGEAVFPTLPAGQYVARFETKTGLFREVPNVGLQPGGATGLGAVVLE